MSSRISRKLRDLGVLCLSFSIAACAMKFTGEKSAADKAAVQPAIDLGENTSQCLSGYADKAVSYFNGELSEQSTSEFWDCASQSLTLFSSKTTGASADEYTPAELQHFLEKYFLAPDEKIPDGLVREAMQIKKVFVGGSSNSISREEIKKTLDWIQTFKKETLRIRPYLPFSLEKVAKMPDAERNRLRAELINVAAQAGEALSKTVEPYSLASLSTLLSELAVLYGKNPETVSKILGFQQQLPVAALMKSLFISSGRDIIRTSDWKLILERGVDATFFYADFQKDWSYLSESPELIANAQNISDQGFHWIQIAIANQPNTQIDFAIFKELLLLAGESRINAWLGKPVKLETIQKTLEAIVVKLLGGAVSKTAFPDAAKATGLTRPVLDYLQAEINQMILVQKSLYKLQHFKAGLTPIDSPLEKEIAELISRRPTLFSSNTLPEMIFIQDQMVGSRKLKDLIQLNWMRTAARMMFRGYSKDSARSSQLTGITADELDEMYLDFWPLGTEMKFLDSRTKKAARKRFLETNLFGFTANGDELLNFEEMLDLMSYILSSKSFSERMYKHTRPICEDAETLGSDPLYQLPLLKIDCFRSAFPKLLLVYTSKNMPSFTQYFKEMNQERQQEALLYLETAGRYAGATNEAFEAGDFDGVAVILHYIESFFHRFDTDRSNIIDQDEAMEAFPVFKNELKKMIEKNTGNKLSDSRVEAVFTYLLKYGETPTPSGLAWWMTRRGAGFNGIEADRLRILKILASLTAGPTTSDSATQPQ